MGWVIGFLVLVFACSESVLSAIISLIIFAIVSKVLWRMEQDLVKNYHNKP